MEMNKLSGAYILLDVISTIVTSYLLKEMRNSGMTVIDADHIQIFPPTLFFFLKGTLNDGWWLF